MAESRKTLAERHGMTELETLRHSCAHVLATALLRLFPDAQFAAGPPVEGGFYYDVDLGHRLSVEDFPAIEGEMAEVVAAGQPFVRQEVSREEARRLGEAGALGALGPRPTPSRYKLDLLARIPEGEAVSLYRNGDFVDLCAGPHVADTGKIGGFKLTNVASAYYQGDEKNPQLQRVYGTAFPTREELDVYLGALEEAKKRDHRRLGRELGLFAIDEEVGQGLILWKPKGATVRRQLQEFISEELRAQGYAEVFTPHIGKLDLFRTSGHYPYYSASQFPPLVEPDALQALADEGCTCAELVHRLRAGDLDGFLLKPMNCPMHIKIYASTPHSYRDLPIRLAEFGTVYRWEQSGELGGMTRVRGFTQDDGHLFCTEEQVEGELRTCLDLSLKVLRTLGLTQFRARLGMRGPDAAKYVGDADTWERAEATLRRAAVAAGLAFTEEAGEGAFYGPKIDFVVKDVIGREWQLGTIQVDYILPARFDLSYVGPDNAPRRPVMIHRAPFGSMERFCGVLIEQFAGAFPVWLAPEQVRVLPISDKVADYAGRVGAQLTNAGVRATVDRSSDKVGAKIRLAQLEKVPYMLVVGAREEEAGKVSVRSRQRGDEGAVGTAEFLARIQQEIAKRQLD